MDFYEIIEVNGDPDAEKEYKAWQAKHKTMLNVVFALLRHPGYCLSNLAFYSNIERWQRLISKEFKANNATTATPSSQRSFLRNRPYDKKWFTIICSVLIGVHSMFMLFQMFGFQFDMYFYIF